MVWCCLQALGVLLYVLCFGRLPFAGDSKLAIINARYDLPRSGHNRPPQVGWADGLAQVMGWGGGAGCWYSVGRGLGGAGDKTNSHVGADCAFTQVSTCMSGGGVLGTWGPLLDASFAVCPVRLFWVDNNEGACHA
jgi:hypothetical protein